MVKHYNPSLRREPRYQALPIVPSKPSETLLDWLKRTGRLKPRDIEIDSCLKNEVVGELENIIDEVVYGSEENE